MDNFEILTDIKAKIKIYTDLLKEIETTPYLVFAKKPLRVGNYYEMINTTGTKTGGVIGIVDLPDDLGFKEYVVQGIKDKVKSLQLEFDSYTINK